MDPCGELIVFTSGPAPRRGELKRKSVECPICLRLVGYSPANSVFESWEAVALVSKNVPHIALACATARGLRAAIEIKRLRPDARLTIFTFPEAKGEPPFVDALQEFSERHSARLIVTRELHDPVFGEIWEQDCPDILIAVCWRYLIPPRIFEMPPRGSFVFHDSLLPRYRGFSPTVWAMINGDVEGGVTLFRLSSDHPETDSGPIVDQRSVPILRSEDIAAVVPRVTEALADLLVRNLDLLLESKARYREQDHARASYTCALTREDALIDWHQSTQRIYNLIRAQARPYPGAYTHLRDRELIIWKAFLGDQKNYCGSIPGRVIDIDKRRGVTVLTGDGSIVIEEVQMPGKPAMRADRLIHSIRDTLE